MLEPNGGAHSSTPTGLAAARLFLAAAAILFLAACVPSPGVTTAPPSPATAAALPDLLVKYMNIQIQSGSACGYTDADLGVRVIVANAGQAPAGLFAVEVNGARQSVTGLEPGATAQLWFPGYQQTENVAVVDPASQVAEADETNNRLAERLPIPTLPPTCTPAALAAAPSSTTVPAAPPTDPPPTAAASPTLAPAAALPTAAPSGPAVAGSASPGIGPASPGTGSAALGTPTPRPPLPTATNKPAAVSVREGKIAIPTYPYADFLTQARSDAYHLSYPVLDRGAYQASGPSPRDVTYRTLILENDVLRLTFLPDLGGRLYEVFYKPTSHRVTYRNSVLKPSPWGPAEQGWWLAAGGIEWCLPIEEHGYEWGVPWTAETARDAKGATVILRDTTAATAASDRVRAVISVRLEAGAGAFTITPRLENPTGAAVAVKYWTNAMLAPGGRNAPSSRLRFVLPDSVASVTVHSRGDDWLPDYNQRLPWPIVDGHDLSLLGNWNRWLGFFEDPAAAEGFMATYDEAYDEGMVRVYPPAVARGAKLFAFGWADPISPDNWTDDRSSYVEMHGGPAPTFDDAVTLPAGGHLQWTETWYPVASLGGLRYANALAALNISAASGKIELAVTATRPWSGRAVLMVNGAQAWQAPVSLAPGQAMYHSLSLGSASGPVALRLLAADGSAVAEYQANLAW